MPSPSCAFRVVEAGRIDEDLVQKRRIFGRILLEKVAAAVKVHVGVVQTVSEDEAWDGQLLRPDYRVRVHGPELDDCWDYVRSCLLLAEGLESGDDGSGDNIADGDALCALVRGDAHEDDICA